MSIASEVSSDVAIAVLTSEQVEKNAELLSVLLTLQSTLHKLSREEHRKRRAKLILQESPPSRNTASANA
jgi:hypothetical protein